MFTCTIYIWWYLYICTYRTWPSHSHWYKLLFSYTSTHTETCSFAHCVSFITWHDIAWFHYVNASNSTLSYNKTIEHQRPANRVSELTWNHVSASGLSKTPSNTNRPRARIRRFYHGLYPVRKRGIRQMGRLDIHPNWGPKTPSVETVWDGYTLFFSLLEMELLSAPILRHMHGVPLHKQVPWFIWFAQAACLFVFPRQRT